MRYAKEKRFALRAVLFVVWLGVTGWNALGQGDTIPNRLSRVEQALGFELLFDGRSLDCWVGFGKGHVPEAWKAKDGTLTFTPGAEGGDLRTKEAYADFDLRLEFRLSPGANSGIMYRSSETRGSSWQTGPEFQILDDSRHGLPSDHFNSCGAVYDLFGPKDKILAPAGQWNSARIVARGPRVQHWLNGVKVVEYEIGSAEWNAVYSRSKFAEYPDFARHPKGYIVLQDHGHEVSFRNIRIRRL